MKHLTPKPFCDEKQNHNNNIAYVCRENSWTPMSVSGWLAGWPTVLTEADTMRGNTWRVLFSNFLFLFLQLNRWGDVKEEKQNFASITSVLRQLTCAKENHWMRELRLLKCIIRKNKKIYSFSFTQSQHSWMRKHTCISLYSHHYYSQPNSTQLDSILYTVELSTWWTRTPRSPYAANTIHNSLYHSPLLTGLAWPGWLFINIHNRYYTYDLDRLSRTYLYMRMRSMLLLSAHAAYLQMLNWNN